jgi:hypothetical protein
MPKTPLERSSHPQRVPAAPEPSSISPPEGLAQARGSARRYLPNAVALWAAVAFGQDSEASLWVRVQCARLLAQVAGAIPQAVPEAPGPHDGAGDEQ